MTFNFKTNKNDSAIQNRTTIDVTMIFKNTFQSFCEKQIFWKQILKTDFFSSDRQIFCVNCSRLTCVHFSLQRLLPGRDRSPPPPPFPPHIRVRVLGEGRGGQQVKN